MADSTSCFGVQRYRPNMFLEEIVKREWLSHG